MEWKMDRVKNGYECWYFYVIQAIDVANEPSAQKLKLNVLCKVKDDQICTKIMVIESSSANVKKGTC
jgi:hypothetical protein